MKQFRVKMQASDRNYAIGNTFNHDNHAHAEKLFNEFNARKPDQLNMFQGICGNRLFMATIAITVVLQVLIIEFLSKFTATVRLNWQLWLVSRGIAFSASRWQSWGSLSRFQTVRSQISLGAAARRRNRDKFGINATVTEVKKH